MQRPHPGQVWQRRGPRFYSPPTQGLDTLTLAENAEFGGPALGKHVQGGEDPATAYSPPSAQFPAQGCHSEKLAIVTTLGPKMWFRDSPLEGGGQEVEQAEKETAPKTSQRKFKPKGTLENNAGCGEWEEIHGFNEDTAWTVGWPGLQETTGEQGG